MHTLSLLHVHRVQIGSPCIVEALSSLSSKFYLVVCTPSNARYSFISSPDKSPTSDIIELIISPHSFVSSSCSQRYHRVPQILILFAARPRVHIPHLQCNETTLVWGTDPLSFGFVAYRGASGHLFFRINRLLKPFGCQRARFRG